jgi:ribose 5-phosphate isomerase A
MATHRKADDHSGLKLRAAQRALELVEPGMTLGLGSGSTATLWIKLLGKDIKHLGK